MPHHLSTSSPTFPPPPSARHRHSGFAGTSDLSIWLSVDPMSDKYPGVSPYVYCANNPVRLVDPDGREFGEYFDMDGNWLGSDGRNDFKIHFVDDPESQAQLRRDATNHRFTTSDVKIKFSTNYFVLSEINDVYDRTLSNGGVCEEGCAFQDEGVCYRSDRGTNRHVELKISHGLISIHSHSFDIVDENDPNKIVGIGIPEKPSGRDEAMFKRFKLNVIVGETQCDPNVNGCERYPRAYFYDSSCNNILKLDIPSIKKVVESYNSVKIGIRNANYTP